MCPINPEKTQHILHFLFLKISSDFHEKTNTQINKNQRCQMRFFKNVKNTAEKRQKNARTKKPFKGGIKCVLKRFY